MALLWVSFHYVINYKMIVQVYWAGEYNNGKK